MLELSFITGVATSVIVYYSVCKVNCSIIVVAGCNIEDISRMSGFKAVY